MAVTGLVYNQQALWLVTRSRLTIVMIVQGSAIAYNYAAVGYMELPQESSSHTTLVPHIIEGVIFGRSRYSEASQKMTQPVLVAGPRICRRATALCMLIHAVLVVLHL